MNAKDTVVGTAEQIVAEIVGDGRLAEEGSCQAGGNRSLSAHGAEADFIPPQSRSTPSDISISQATPHNDEDRFAMLLGHAALKVWSDLPRAAHNYSPRRWTTASSRIPLPYSCTIVIRKPRTRRNPR